MDWHLNSDKHQRNTANSEHLQPAKHSAYVISLRLTTDIRGRSYRKLHFKDEKAGKKGSVTSMSHSC